MWKLHQSSFETNKAEECTVSCMNEKNGTCDKILIWSLNDQPQQQQKRRKYLMADKSKPCGLVYFRFNS